MKVQHEFNQKLVAQLEKIEQRQMERDHNLMQTLLETLEIKELPLQKKSL